MKIITIVILCLVSCNTLWAQSVEDYLQKGDAFHKRFQTQAALSEYKQALAISSTNFEVLSKTVAAYNNAGEDLDTPESEHYYRHATILSERLLTNYPNEAESHFLAAISYGNLALLKGGGEKVELSRFVQRHGVRAIELDNQFFKAYLVMGIYYREVATMDWFLKILANTLLGGIPDGSLEDSLEMLTKSLEMSPLSIKIHFELAQTYLKLNNKEKAKHHLVKLQSLEHKDHSDGRWVREAKLQLKEVFQ